MDDTEKWTLKTHRGTDMYQVKEYCFFFLKREKSPGKIFPILDSGARDRPFPGSFSFRCSGSHHGTVP